MNLTLSNGADTVRVALETGHICDLTLNGITPLHRAPWIDAPEVQRDTSIPLVERGLQGDFFCAPFGKSDLIDGPIHGMTANSPWEVIAQTDSRVVLRLRVDVMGAQIEKTVALEGGALFQTHRIIGGSGGLTVAHHPMVRMAQGADLSYSAKALAVTPDHPLEPGRNWLRYLAQTTDLKRFPGRDSLVDLTRYPDQPGHEDFVTLIEADGAALGWTAISRHAEKDLIVIVKDPRVLPVTMLWFSNGGRDYAPWNGRHRGVLGIEDGCAAGAAGHRAAVEQGLAARFGVPTCLRLGDTHVIEHAIYTVPLAQSVRVTDMTVQDQTLVATCAVGPDITLGQAPNWL